MVFSAQNHLKTPSPPISAVISSMRSNGNGGSHSGFMAMDMSFMGLSSAATRLALSAPQRLHRWMIAHSPPLRTQDGDRFHDAAAVAGAVAWLYV